MNILITNDDGFDAEGISALTEALAGLGRLLIVAPTENKSGASSSLSLHKDIAVYRRAADWYAVDGTPVDCVHLALTGDFLPVRPDLVVSGINSGANLGDDTIYSGTVAAAIEGFLFNIPSFAFSITDNPVKYFPTAAATVRNLVEQWIKQPPPLPPCLLNVNIPDIPPESLCGFVCTRLGRRYPAKAAVNKGGRDDVLRFAIGNVGDIADGGNQTDFHAIAANKVSITPLTVDMTNQAQIIPLAQWLSV